MPRFEIDRILGFTGMKAPRKKKDKKLIGFAALTAKQQLFVMEYVKHPNGKRAAIKAGYAPLSACSMASDLLTFPNVKQAVRDKQAEKLKRIGITQERVLLELARVGYARTTDILSWNSQKGMTLTDSKDLLPRAKAAVSEVSETRYPDGSVNLKFKMHKKVQALIALGKHVKLGQGGEEEGQGDPDGDSEKISPEKYLAMLEIRQQRSKKQKAKAAGDEAVRPEEEEDEDG